MVSTDAQAQPSARPRTPREKVWRLVHDGHVQTCELRDDSKAGPGWDVMLLEDGEPLLSKRCATDSSHAGRRK